MDLYTREAIKNGFTYKGSNKEWIHLQGKQYRMDSPIREAVKNGFTHKGSNKEWIHLKNGFTYKEAIKNGFT